MVQSVSILLDQPCAAVMIGIEDSLEWAWRYFQDQASSREDDPPFEEILEDDVTHPILTLFFPVRAPSHHPSEAIDSSFLEVYQPNPHK